MAHDLLYTQADTAYSMRKLDLLEALDDTLDSKDLPLDPMSISGTEVIHTDFMGNICIPKVTQGIRFLLLVERKLSSGIYAL